MRNFEEFTLRSTPASRKRPRVAIQRRGTISLNHAAYQAMNEPDAVILLFDRDSQAIGLKPVAVDVRHAYPVRRQPASKSYVIAGTAFCQHYGIDVGQTRSFDPVIEGEMLILELASGVLVTSRGKRSQSENGSERTKADDGSESRKAPENKLTAPVDPPPSTDRLPLGFDDDHDHYPHLPI